MNVHVEKRSTNFPYSKDNSKIFPCGDLLELYGKKPNTLEFLKCDKKNDAQVILQATYQVSGKNSKLIEDFLVEHYGMGKLKWTCCGWETGGKYGILEHPEFKKIDNHCLATISMFSSAEAANEDNPTEIRLETTKTKIDFFTVVVELVVV